MSAPVLSTEPEYAQIQQSQGSSRSFDDVKKVYSTDEIAEIILQKDFKRPCIQFCDDLVVDASKMAQLVEQQANRKVFVLADTSYSPCCVDEVAAQHIKADVIFHLGNACLNPVIGVPVYYVLHRVDIDVAALREKLKPRKCVVYADTQYTFALDSLENPVALPSHGEFVPSLKPREGFESEIPNRVLSEPVETGEHEIVYLSSSPSDSLMLYFSTIFASVSVIDPQSLDLVETRQFLRKRYRLVEMAKSAATVGILVNTTSLKYMRELLDTTKKWVKESDKKYYTFTVGKPNVAKLANFEVIDVWVVLGCPLGGLIVDSSDYIKPIVTPFELKMALCFDWNGQWIIDLQQTLELDGQHHQREFEQEGPHFDVVRGRLVNNAPMRRDDDDDNGSSQLVKATQSLTIGSVVSTAADHLRGRHWQGLGSDFSSDPDQAKEYAELKQGQSGIARDYHEN